MPTQEPATDPLQTRQRILEAAGEVFAEQGFRGATVRDICRRAEANVAAVNYHFGDKLALYTEVVQQFLQAAEIEGIRNALDQTAPPEDILRAVIHARLRSLTRGDRPDWHFRILAHELAQPTPVIRQHVNQIGRPLFNRMLGLVGGMLGLPPDAEKTKLCAISVMGQILVYVFATPLLAGVWPELKMTPQQIDQVADHIADFSLEYIRNFRSNSQQAGPNTRSARPRLAK